MASELDDGERGLTIAEAFSLKKAWERGDASSLPQTYTERFEEVCPSYMAIGMTWEQFWDGDSDMVVAFRKADRLKAEVKNRDAWLQGMYFYEALCDVSPIIRAFSKAKKPIQYPSEPYEYKTDETKKIETKEEKSDKKAKSIMEMFMVSFNERLKAKQKYGENIDGRNTGN